MAESKHHQDIHHHVKRMRQHASAINDSADKIEQIMSAMKGGGPDQQPEQPAQAAPSGVSPLGGQAQ